VVEALADYLDVRAAATGHGAATQRDYRARRRDLGDQKERWPSPSTVTRYGRFGDLLQAAQELRVRQTGRKS
jgi:hypothetical protein